MLYAVDIYKTKDILLFVSSFVLFTLAYKNIITTKQIKNW